MFERAIQFLVSAAISVGGAYSTTQLPVGAGSAYLTGQMQSNPPHSHNTRDAQKTQREVQKIQYDVQKTQDDSKDAAKNNMQLQYQVYRDNFRSIVSPLPPYPEFLEFSARFMSATHNLEGPALFGHEFTFILPKDSSEYAYLNQWEKKIRNFCQAQCQPDKLEHLKDCCTVKYYQESESSENVDARVRITYPDGWWYEVKPDEGVLEVIGKPLTAAEIADNVDRIQDQIFDFARNNLNIVPHELQGGGHIHIGVTSGFRNSARQLRNFFVDIENHPAMFLGAISNSILNSPLAIETEDSREAFKVELDNFDRDVMSKESWSDTIKILFFSHLMVKCDRDSALPHRDIEKAHVVNVNHISVDMEGKYTLEIRGLLPQKNAKEYSLLVKLFDARIKYLQQSYKDHLIKYEGKTLDFSRIIFLDDQGERTDRVRFNPKTKLPVVIDPKQSLDEFNNYVLESGLDPRDFNVLMKNDL